MFEKNLCTNKVTFAQDSFTIIVQMGNFSVALGTCIRINFHISVLSCREVKFIQGLYVYISRNQWFITVHFQFAVCHVEIHLCHHHVFLGK